MKREMRDMARNLARLEGSRGHDRSPPRRPEYKKTGYDHKKSYSGAPTCYKCFEKGHIESFCPKK